MLMGALAVCIALVLITGAIVAALFLKLRQLEERLHALQESSMQQQAALNKRLDTYLTGSIQMGEQLYKLQQQLAPIPEKLQQIEHRDPSMLSFTEAARLVGLGATSENLQQACGLSQAEADLLIRMQQKQSIKNRS